MRKLIVITLLFFGICSAYSQTDSLFLISYEQKILEINKLKNDLQTEKQNFSDLSDAYKTDTIALQKQIKVLQKDIEKEKHEVSNLNKNKVKAERDVLLNNVDSLNSLISTLNTTISDKNKQITTVKTTGEQKALEEKEKGKAEALASFVNFYKNQLFDDLIKSSTQESVGRDMLLVGNYPDVKEILNDLQIYFNAEELLAKKFDVVQIKKAQMQLSQLKFQSKILEALKDNLEYYQDFSTALKETISKLVDLDNRKSADGDSEIQKMKFNEIATELTEYMYDYYDYGNYPYLSNIVLEIIKRKQPNADADISDLLIKL